MLLTGHNIRTGKFQKKRFSVTQQTGRPLSLPATSLPPLVVSTRCLALRSLIHCPLHSLSLDYSHAPPMFKAPACCSQTRTSLAICSSASPCFPLKCPWRVAVPGTTYHCACAQGRQVASFPSLFICSQMKSHPAAAVALTGLLMASLLSSIRVLMVPNL